MTPPLPTARGRAAEETDLPTADDQTAVQMLATLGFSETEALAYTAVLRRPGSTGYRVARAINKAQANTYQALNSLVEKGAVVFEEGETRSFRAVPASELMERVRREHERTIERARASLSAQGSAESEERIYRLRDREQVLERARAMLAVVEETATLHWFPSWTEALRPDVEAAVARGVKVALMVLREEDGVPGARTAVSRMAARVLEVWPADPLLLVIDGRQFLLALAERTGGVLRHGYWGSNRFVSTILHNALSSDILVHDSDLIPSIGGSIQMHMFGRLPPGFREMIQGAPAAPDEGS